MTYAHLGSSKDSAFTIIDGVPTRSFMAFENDEDRNLFSDFIWKKSGNEKNLINCKRKDVERWMGSDFVVDPQGFVQCRK